MSTSDSERDPVERLAEEFAGRLRRGERPALSEYTGRYPQYADQIRELFPALVAMEQLKPQPGDLTGDFDGLGLGDTSPRQLGEYRLLREVGRGGMGVVYEAEQASLGRRVALKVLPPQARLNPTYLERFKREAKAAARLHHTNIVPVFGVGEADGVPFYAMQFITGEGLDRVLVDLRRLRGQAGTASAPASALLSGLRPAPAADGAAGGGETDATAPASSGLSMSGQGGEYHRGVARVGLQVAEALAYAHRQGILHRDVKPSNLLLDGQGNVWVTDFGLAKAEGSDELTGTGDIVGTLRFMAPERFDGQSLPQSDVYALGVTLYEMLTLRPAFDDANKAKLIDRVLHEMPPRPRRFDPAVPRDLETVVLKCLAKGPAERYATADDLAEDLRRFLADRPIKARRASGAEKAWRWCRRNPALAALSAALLLVLVVTAAGGVILSLLLNSARLQAQSDAGKARDEEINGRHKLFEAYLAEARANRLARRTGQRFDTLARIAAAAELARELGLPQERFDELRHVAVTALSMPDLSPRYLGEYLADQSLYDLSDDLSQLLTWDVQARTHVILAVPGGAELYRLPAPKEQCSAFFGPAGRHIVRYHSQPGHPVELWATGGPGPRLLRRDSFPVQSHHFRPDGRYLALMNWQGTLAVWDLATNTEARRFTLLPEGHDSRLALHPTEPLVATTSYHTRRVFLRDFRTGVTVASIATPWPGGSYGPVWAPDGRRLFVPAADSGEVQEYGFDPAARQLRPRRRLATAGGGGGVLAINPAGDRMAIRDWGGPPSVLDLETGRPLFTAKVLHTIDRLRFTPDGRSLIGIYGTQGTRSSYGVVEVGDAREVRTIPLSKSGGHRPVIHPGGRLAVIAQDDRFAFVDLASLRELAVVKRGTPRFVSLAFDGEGRLYSNSYEGCFLWPVRFEGERVTVGPPERLPLQGGSEGVAVSPDGRTIAQGQFLGYGMQGRAGGWLLTPGRPDDPIHVMPGKSVTLADISRDGRLVCFGVHASHLEVFDARTGRPVWNNRAEGGAAACRFTPDGRWLVGNRRAYRVGDWGTSVLLDASRTGGLQDVSPDSRHALLSTTEGYVRMVEIATGREVVRFEPSDGYPGHLGFTPDGTRLVGAGSEGLRVWDLRRLRRELGKLGLDWDAPPYPEAPSAPAPAPLQLAVHGGEMLSDPAKLRAYDQQRLAARLATDPFDAPGNLDLARDLMRAGRFGEALRHLERALLTRPRAYPARMNRGICLMRLGRPGTAVSDFTAVAAARPEDYRPQLWRADAYRRLKKYDLAAADLTEVLKSFPEDGELYEERADCYRAMGEKAREAADRESARRHDPRQPRDLNIRAWALLTGPPASRDPKRALELIRKAVAINPDEPTYYNTLGVALYRNGRWAEAVTALEKSLARARSDHAAFDLYFLAMTHARMGEPGQAKECFDRAVKSHAEAKGLTPRELGELRAFRQEAEGVLAGR